MNIRFLKHKVANDKTKQSARVSYSLDNRTDGRKCVTIYAKEYGNELSKVFVGEPVQNDTDTMTDYFCKDTVRLFEDHPMYIAARAAVEKFERERTAKFDKKYGRVSTPTTEPVTAGGGVYSDLLVRLGVKSIALL